MRVRYVCIILFLLLLLYGCSSVGPPTDYYQKIQEMEDYGERARSDIGRSPDEEVTTPRKSEPVKVVKLPPEELPEGQEENILKGINQGSAPDINNDIAVGKETEKPVQPKVSEESPPSTMSSQPSSSLSKAILPSKPISVASEVIRSALESTNLGINVRNIELVNGRLTGGNNSVRVNFLCESINLIDDKFLAICAVTYHLNKSSNTIDVVVGIAEDQHSNLIGIIQSDMEDISAWMTDRISRAEWFSRVTKKVL